MCAPTGWSTFSPARKARNLAYQRDGYARRVAFIRRYKSFCGCIDCGEHDWRCLDIDHTDGKSNKIPSLRSIAAIKAEIRRHKCVVRCANCHRKRTYEEQLGRPAKNRNNHANQEMTCK